MPLLIEPPVPGDSRAMAQLHVQAWQQAYRGILPEALLAGLSVDRREAQWAQAIAADASQLRVARADGELAGFVAFGASRAPGATPADAEIRVLNLAPRFWSQGIGRQLVLACRERLLGQGAASLSLWVLEENARARRFYESLGFRLRTGAQRTFSFEGASAIEVGYAWPHAD